MSDTEVRMDVDVAAGGALKIPVTGREGAREVAIQATSSSTFSVDVTWIAPDGTEIRTDTAVFGGSLTGGDWQTGTVTAFTHRCIIKVQEDAGVADATMSGSGRFVIG